MVPIFQKVKKNSAINSHSSQLTHWRVMPCPKRMISCSDDDYGSSLYSPHISEMTNIMMRLVPVSQPAKLLWHFYVPHPPFFFLVWFPRFLAFSGQSESQLAVRGSQEKVSMSVCLLFIRRSTMTHRHAALTPRPPSPSSGPGCSLSSGRACYE